MLICRRSLRVVPLELSFFATAVLTKLASPQSLSNMSALPNLLMSAETEEWVDQVQAEIRRKAQHGSWSDMAYQIYNANYDLGHITLARGRCTGLPQRRQQPRSPSHL